MKLKILILAIILTSCDTYDNWSRHHGEPKYKVFLLNDLGEVIDTKIAHEKRESWDWGMSKNYNFTYYGFRFLKDSKKYGDGYSDTWEWPKTSVRIERTENEFGN